MATFEKKVNYTIDFETPILIKHQINKLVSYSSRIFKNSIVAFNGYVKSNIELNVVFISFIIDNKDKQDFKNMTISDIKNIIYNTVIEMEF